MTSTPMYFPPEPFRLADAVECSTLVGTAYDMYAQWLAQGKPEERAFRWTPKGPPLAYSAPIWGAEKFLWVFRHREPFGFVAWTGDGVVYLVFRGTESLDDWIDDLEDEHRPYPLAPDYGRVHDGFLKLYETMNDTVLRALAEVPRGERLFVTGHSLGSGLSTLAVPAVITHSDYRPGKRPVLHYNLASPRVGDPAFATAYNTNRVPTYRVVNTCDLVPQVPPAVFHRSLFQHVGTPVDFTAQYGSIGGNHSAAGSYHYALTHPEQPQGPLPESGGKPARGKRGHRK